MIKNGVVLSIKECETILELISMAYKTRTAYQRITPEQLSLITQLRSVVQDDPIGTHIEQYHEE
jgi:hypothetical protein